MKKIEYSLREQWDTINRQKKYIMGIPKREETEGWADTTMKK